MPLEDITGFIVSRLRPLEPSSDRSKPKTFQTQLAQQPKEILDQIVLQLQPIGAPLLTCTRVLPPSLWREALLYQNLLPWLWDLTPSEIPSSYLSDSSWDWELLVRELSQIELFENEELRDDTALGLRNRRRIWRIVEETRFGDLYDPSLYGPPGCTCPSEIGLWQLKHNPELRRDLCRQCKDDGDVPSKSH